MSGLNDACCQLSRNRRANDRSNFGWPGTRTKYQYDGLSDPTGQTSPDTGTTARTFDAAGNVLTATDAKGIVVTYTYDAQNRRLSASYPDSTQNITYHYDEANTVTGCSTSYPIGHLTRIVENTVTTVYCYDAQGRVIEKEQTTGSTTHSTGYTYTAAGRLSGIAYPSGTQVSYTRDSDGRIQSLSVTPPSGTASTVVSGVTYQPFGPVSGYTLGNGQAVARTYDANYRLTDLTSPAFSLHVARDAMGDITAIGNAAGANPATETYSYDPLYRLTAITEASGSVLEGVTYNPTGDRLTKTGSGLDTGAYSYNTNTHQLVATGSYARSVDADGNTTAITAASGNLGFGYNDRNRLAVAQVAGSTVANYAYDALGERIGKTTGTTGETYSYDEGQQLLSEQGATNRDYVWMGGIPVANVDTTGTTSTIAYVTADQLNVPRAISNSAGTTIWQWAYPGNAWGELAPTSTTGYAYNLRLPGQYFDGETGLNYNMHRGYDPGTGRYIEFDPLGLKAGLNGYAYVGGNPLSNIDRMGLQEFPAGAAAGDAAASDAAATETEATAAAEAEAAAAAAGLPEVVWVDPNNPATWPPSPGPVNPALQCPASSAPNFVVTPEGTAFPVPEGVTGPFPTQNPGFQFNGGAGGNGLANNVTDVRFMDPNAQNPNGYVNYGSRQSNGGWQSVNPYTGKPIPPSNPWWHIPQSQP